MDKCLKCGGTGITVDGEVCDCGCLVSKKETILLEVPKNYRINEFSASLVPIGLPVEYGMLLENTIRTVKESGTISENMLICSPPNSGKTVFAYTIYKYMYMSRLPVPSIIDLIEARDLIMNNYFYDTAMQLEKEKLISSSIAIIKIPLDLPNKFVETISTVLERRMRRGGYTIFLYGGTIYDLKNQDKRGLFNNLIGDGTYNSFKVYNYTVNKPKQE